MPQRNVLLFISLCLALSTQNTSAQSPANKTIAALYQKMQAVKDYTVNAIVRAEIPMIKIDPVHATIYFKQKDRIRVISNGIALLPKEGLSSVSKIIQDPLSYTATLQRKETLQNRSAEVINIVPNSDTGDVVLAKLWIDPARHIVLKSNVTYRTNGPVQVEYYYGQQTAYGLPDSMTFTISVKKFKMPKGVATDIQKNKLRTQQDESNAPKEGKIFIALTNYAINKGIKDEIFK